MVKFWENIRISKAHDNWLHKTWGNNFFWQIFQFYMVVPCLSLAWVSLQRTITECRETDTKKNYTQTNTSTLNGRQAQQNACTYVWTVERMARLFGPITKRSKAKPKQTRIRLSTLKTAVVTKGGFISRTYVSLLHLPVWSTFCFYDLQYTVWTQELCYK